MSTSVRERYELLLDLAAGGMATVHIGRRIGAAGFDRLVVVKRIHAHLSGNPAFHDMFVDEARLSSNVHHPNVVPIVDVVDDGGELSLVMDYVESVSLAALFSAAKARDSRLPREVLSRICGDALLGLHAAHEAVDANGTSLSLVHRDVSPQNVIVGTDGAARLIDFGIAKAAERITITEDDALKGKLRYMSPEQGRREPLDRRSDVFALALVLYEGLAGRPAIEGTDDVSIWISLMAGDVAPALDLPVEIREVLETGLARTPETRFSTALDFERALRAAIPPASAEEVAACVLSLLGPEVEARRQAIRDARRSPPAPVSSASRLSAGASASPTSRASRASSASTVSTVSAPARRRRMPMVALGLIGAATLAAVVLVVLVVLVGRASSSVARTTSASASTSAPMPVTIVETPPPAPAADSASSSAASVAVAGEGDAGNARRGTTRSPSSAPARGSKLHGNPYVPAAH